MRPGCRRLRAAAHPTSATAPGGPPPAQPAARAAAAAGKPSPAPATDGRGCPAGRCTAASPELCCRWPRGRSVTPSPACQHPRPSHHPACACRAQSFWSRRCERRLSTPGWQTTSARATPGRGWTWPAASWPLGASTPRRWRRQGHGRGGGAGRAARRWHAQLCAHCRLLGGRGSAVHVELP